MRFVCYTVGMAGEKQTLEKLKEYFKKRDDVVMAFLFGSRAKGENYLHGDSDWDIAVYFQSKNGRPEWDRNSNYPERSGVRDDLSKILKTDKIDVVVLNHAYPLIAAAALDGRALVVKNRRIWLEFMLRLTNEALDFTKTSREYAEIYWRSTSLAAEDAVALEERLVFLDSEFKTFIERYSIITWKEYQEDDMKRKVLERSCEILINTVIDISKIILAASKKSRPHAYDEIVSGAALLLSLEEEKSKTLSKFVPLRNLLAHEYLDYRWKEIGHFLEMAPHIFPALITAAKKFLEKNREKNAA